MDMPRNEATEYDIAIFVAEYTQQENLLPDRRQWASNEFSRLESSTSNDNANE